MINAIVNTNSIVQHVTQIKNGIMKDANMSVKTVIITEKIKVWTLADLFMKLASIVDESVIMCNEVLNITSNIPTNLKSVVSTDFDDKNVRHKMNCCILQTVLVVIILLLMIAFICYYYAKQRSKQNVLEF